MSLNPKQIAILLGGLVVVIILVVLIATNLRSSTRPQPVALSVWGAVDDQKLFEETVAGYRAAHPNVEIKYQKLDPARYRETVVNALAAGQGPDVLMIGNRALPREKNKLIPVPPTAFSLARLRELFPTVVEQDFADRDGQIYALPQSLDTLALLYNRDQFDAAGIVSPPVTWDEFQKDVTLLRKVNPQGQLVARGAALGATDRTVSRGSDLLALLMLQSGSGLADPATGAANFSSTGALSAFAFYLQFANPASPVYTWSDAETPALESFAAKNVAMVFGYKSDADAVRARSPFLNFAVAPVPQRAGSDAPVGVANYWGYAVSKQSKAPAAAWDVVIYFATDPTAAANYVNASLAPPALRSLIRQTLQDLSLGVFSRQALTARSWYEADDDKIREILNAAIDRVLKGQRGPADALREAQDQINQLR